MTGDSMAIASAVIVPESLEKAGSPSGSAKRRKSSVSEHNAKRPRLNPDDSTTMIPPASTPTAQAAERRKSGQLEERKRGQRLFGALLGTLSQSSSSTAQKRRTDIERKQQAKLKLQDDELDEKKKQRLDAIMDYRRQEQKEYDKQSMQIRHSNLLAQARFLKTKAKPELYYKPWELLPREEEEIKAQIERVERDIERESEQFDVDNPDGATGAPDDRQDEEESKNHQPGPLETVGLITDNEAQIGTEKSNTTNADAVSEVVKIKVDFELPEASKDHNDDGGEVVEGEEDTVIY